MHVESSEWNQNSWFAYLFQVIASKNIVAYMANRLRSDFDWSISRSVKQKCKWGYVQSCVNCLRYINNNNQNITPRPTQQEVVYREFSEFSFKLLIYNFYFRILHPLSMQRKESWSWLPQIKCTHRRAFINSVTQQGKAKQEQWHRSCNRFITRL